MTVIRTRMLHTHTNTRTHVHTQTDRGAQKAKEETNKQKTAKDRGKGIKRKEIIEKRQEMKNGLAQYRLTIQKQGK